MNALSSSTLAIVLAAAAAVTAPASAVTLEVARRDLPQEVRITDASFDVDAKSGRVRVALDYFDDSFQGTWFSERVTVPGLVFDRASREIRYEGGGSSVTCATAKKVLWATTYPMKDGCRIIVTNASGPRDDEFRGSATTMATVRLAVDQPERAARLKQ